jgi:hypothetical protein
MIMKPTKKPRMMIINEEGFVLVLCLIVIAVLSLVGGSALMISATNQQIVMNYKKQTQAFNVSEAGLQFGLARVRSNPLWRGDETANPQTRTEYMFTGDVLGWYTLYTYDRTDDNNGIYDPLVPAGYVKLVSEGRIPDAQQRIEIFVQLIPDPTVTVDVDDKAIITSGGNSSPQSVHGYDPYGNEDDANMVDLNTTLPTVDQDGVRALADFSFDELTDTEVENVLQEDPPSTAAPTPQVDFWKDPGTETKPWVIHVKGDLDISGDFILYGIIFVEGGIVNIRGKSRVHGIVYAPNATVFTKIRGGGAPNAQPVMGQVIAGDGGVVADGEHADVQLIPAYVEAFRNLGGDVNTAEIADGSWRQY